MENEYIKLTENENLLGKRARFKNNLMGYCADLWLKEGVIIQHKGVEHVGLSLKFDVPSENLDTCYIAPNSIEMLGD